MPVLFAQVFADTWINRQVVFDGFVEGMVYGLLALGIVLIYRSTRVINFAVGNMGLPGAVLFALLVLNWGVPFWLAASVALVLGAAIGACVDLVVVRRLFNSPRVVLLVATVGVAQLMQMVVIALPDFKQINADYPVAIGKIFHPLDGLRVVGPKISILIVVPLLTIALAWTLNRTMFGKAVAASADNPDLGRLSGVNPKLVSTFVWIMGGVLSTFSIILLSGGGGVNTLSNLGPSTLTRALAASVLAGMRSFPRALAAGVVIGITQKLIGFNFHSEIGLIEFILFITVLIAVYFQSRRSDREAMVSGFTPQNRPVPERLQALWFVRRLPRMGLGLVFALAVVVPLLHDFRASQLLLYSTIAATAVCAVSATIVTGWAGQLSLSQMAFAGIGALTAAALTRGAEMDIGWGSRRIIDFQLDPMPFGASIIIASLLTGLLATIVGLGALRVRGLLLAVSTFAFAVAAEQYLFRRPFFSDGSSYVRFERGELLGLDISDQRTYFYVCLGVLAAVVAVTARLRQAGSGRSIIAVRDNADAASAYTVSPTRMKLLAFGIGGVFAGLGGGLLGGLVRSIRYSETFFLVSDSLQIVAIVVIGGLGTVAGPLLGSLWVVGLPAFWPDNEVVPLLSSSVGLLIVLLYFPGGLVQVAYRIRDAFLGWADRRFDLPSPQKSSVELPESIGKDKPRTDPPPVVLATSQLQVRFGGVVAVDKVGITVGRDEIVGLIGTNGAGKTTLMNAIGGYVPSTGTVELLGRPVSRLSAPARARRGLGRTFQAAALFPELTVRETVKVALEARGRSSLLRSALYLDWASEKRRAAEAAELIDFLGLGRFADSYVSELSTGTRRIVELAGLLAVDARVLCLDEPTAGVAQREAEAFGPLIRRIGAEMEASILIIEHDMPLIMSISDRVYCLELGTVIAEGRPEEVRNNPAVIRSYLGTDERAIARSDTPG